MRDVDSPKKEYLSLYCLKALCALMVVIIHLGIYEKESIMFMLRCAVPCFLLSADISSIRGKRRKKYIGHGVSLEKQYHCCCI